METVHLFLRTSTVEGAPLRGPREGATAGGKRSTLGAVDLVKGVVSTFTLEVATVRSGLTLEVLGTTARVPTVTQVARFAFHVLVPVVRTMELVGSRVYLPPIGSLPLQLRPKQVLNLLLVRATSLSAVKFVPGYPIWWLCGVGQLNFYRTTFYYIFMCWAV